MRAVAVAAALLLSLPAAFSLAQDQPGLNADQQARYENMIHELRCLVCQNQTIADSAAPLAADLRDQVRHRIAGGESDADVRRYVTDRYGDYVLYKPPLTARTVLLWIGPFALLAGALLSVLVFTRRSQGRARASRADPETLRRLLEQEKNS